MLKVKKRKGAEETKNGISLFRIAEAIFKVVGDVCAALTIPFLAGEHVGSQLKDLQEETASAITQISWLDFFK